MPRDDDQTKRYQDALDAMNVGRLATAERLLQTNLLAGPRAAQSRYALGVVELVLGRTEIARQLIDSAYSIKAWLRDLEPDVIALEEHAVRALETYPDWAWPRYELERRSFYSVGLRLDHVVRAHLTGPDPFFVEVGANDGKSHDPIYGFVTKHGWSGVCIEPVPDTHAQLVANYADHPGVDALQLAIAPEHSEVELHLSDRSTLASITPDRNSLSRAAETRVITVSAKPLDAVLEERAVDRLDLLQIDTEGYDYQVLRTIDLARWHPMVVNMEFYCLPLGERLATFALLRANGYAYRFDGMDLIAVDRDRASNDFCIVDLTAGRWLAR